ncbi:integral membrane regulator [Streptomyces sp. NPDC017993]|uniref:integral membrane regulator n=1 Tax=Streptomyces sp. NPDC017993 TaxID=3365027 RepID=UPI00379CBC50
MSDPTRTSQSTRHATGAARAADRTPATAVAPAVRRPLAAAVRALIATAALTGLATEADLTPDLPLLLGNFTVQANIAVALVFIWSSHRAWTGRRPAHPLLTGAALFFITLAALLVHAAPSGDTGGFALPGAPTGPAGALSIAGPLLHTVTPLAALADWLLLTAPGGFRRSYAWQWSAYPLLYLAFTFLPSPPPHALAIALTACLLPLITIAIDQVRPSPRLHRNRISPTGISPLK